MMGDPHLISDAMRDNGHDLKRDYQMQLIQTI
jgi:hypothetical protein